MFKLIQYNAETFVEKRFDKARDVFAEVQVGKVNWINLDINGSIEELNSFAELFSIHHLIMDDALNTRHLPKFEPFEEYFFLTLKMLTYDEDQQTINNEHLSILLGPNYVITFQEDNNVDVFEEVRIRLRNSLGRLRQRQSDYLFYRLLDSVVDQYIYIIENLREQIETMEEYLLGKITSTDLFRITQLKRVISEFRKFVLPLRDEVVHLKNDHCDFILKSTRPYLQDIIDHLTYVNTYFENFREMLRNLMDLHQSQISQSMNIVMKTLTVVTSIFIPLTFIVGVYGMNFKYFPELYWTWSYPVLWIIMIAISISMGVYMKRKKWF